MDHLWWGIDNNAWVAFYRKNKMCPSVNELLLLPREDFYTVDCHISYPLAGSFCNYLLMRFGKEVFRRLYLAKDYSIAVKEILGCSLPDLEKDFFQYVDFLSYDEKVYTRMEELLHE